MSAYDLVARCPTFAHLDPAYQQRLAASAPVRQAPARTLLFRQGDACPGIFVIGSGSIRIFKVAPSGKEHLLRQLDAPNSFLEVPVIGGFDCPACAETTTPARLLVIPIAVIRDLLDHDHAFCKQMLVSLSQRVRMLVGLLEDIVLRDATSRVANHLLEHADRSSGLVRLPGHQKDLASHLNLTPETLSRSLRQLAQQGFILQDGGDITVIKRLQLEQLVAQGAFPQP